MPYEFYRVLHLIGVFMVVGSLSAMCLHVINGGGREYKARKAVGALHGIGLLIVLVSGFGILARLGLVSGMWPNWVSAKLVIWVLLGGLAAPIYRKPKLAKLFWVIVFLFATLAAYFCIYKPF